MLSLLTIAVTRNASNTSNIYTTATERYLHPPHFTVYRQTVALSYKHLMILQRIIIIISPQNKYLNLTLVYVTYAQSVVMIQFAEMIGSESAQE